MEAARPWIQQLSLGGEESENSQGSFVQRTAMKIVKEKKPQAQNGVSYANNL